MNYLLEFERILSADSEWGIRNVPIRKNSHDSPFIDRKHQKQFFSACHRGYEKAQNHIIDILSSIASDNRLEEDEKIHWELCFRRIIDTIAFIMVRTATHIARRLVLHDSPPAINMSVIKENKYFADQLNAKSRLTFALLADLSTFIHVCDILRIDFRQELPNFSLIEVKSGKINEMLLHKLSSCELEPEVLQNLSETIPIEKRHLAQAKRILKQKIRLEQIM